jgi:hypothetical protein
MSTKTRVRLAAAALGGAALMGSVVAAPIEPPRWERVVQHSGWEVREYAPRLEARVTVHGETMQEASRRGFRVLAAFIFGDNVPASSIEMTAPVSTTSTTKIAMTAPVGASQVGTDEWTVAFTMPSEYSTETLPQPTDPRIEIVEVPGGMWAAARFRGRAQSRYAAARQSLEASLIELGIGATGPAEIAQYDPPWIPTPFRRNEILIQVAR